MCAIILLGEADEVPAGSSSSTAGMFSYINISNKIIIVCLLGGQPPLVATNTTTTGM